MKRYEGENVQKSARKAANNNSDKRRQAYFPDKMQD